MLKGSERLGGDTHENPESCFSSKKFAIIRLRRLQMNACRPETELPSQYLKIRDAIWEALPEWSAFIVSIDGRDSAGKSSLGRYLAWQLGMPRLELDTFRDLSGSAFQFHLQNIKRAIDSRLCRDRPVIVEGVTVLKVLSEMDYAPNFTVFVEYQSGELPELAPDLKDYLNGYKPHKNAAYVYERLTAPGRT